MGEIARTTTHSSIKVIANKLNRLKKPKSMIQLGQSTIHRGMYYQLETPLDDFHSCYMGWGSGLTVPWSRFGQQWIGTRTIFSPRLKVYGTGSIVWAYWRDICPTFINAVAKRKVPRFPIAPSPVMNRISGKSDCFATKTQTSWRSKDSDSHHGEDRSSKVRRIEKDQEYSLQPRYGPQAPIFYCWALACSIIIVISTAHLYLCVKMEKNHRGSQLIDQTLLKKSSLSTSKPRRPHAYWKGISRIAGTQSE